MTKWQRLTGKKHRASILQKKDGTCLLCILLHDDYRLHRHTEEHHVFGGPNRPISEATGLKCYLCVEHHRTGPEAVHRSSESRQRLQAYAQQVYERSHPREEFMELFGRNYR